MNNSIRVMPNNSTTMTSNNSIRVTSEIGTLEAVLLHRPGREIENLVPEYLGNLLFDDIPYLPVMQKEHDYFAQTLRNHDVEVLYLEDLLAEVLRKPEAKRAFVHEVFTEQHRVSEATGRHLLDYLLSLSAEELVQTMIGGFRKDELPTGVKHHLNDYIHDRYPFYLDPLPNLYFTRDPAAVIGRGISVNRMFWQARTRESLFIQYVVRYHPLFANVPIWFNREGEFSMEGGDQLVLSRDTVFIGVSERTSSEALEVLAARLLGAQQKCESGDDRFRRVVAIEIPKTRSFMHLDTVFTMVDVDKFTVHPDVLGRGHEMGIYVLESDGEGGLDITPSTDLITILKESLHLSDVDIIPCGGGDSIAAAREQWNDGSNTLAIAPGVVVTYDRNCASNQALREHGVEVIEVPGSELGRGRGGPRCMSMPLSRKELKG